MTVNPDDVELRELDSVAELKHAEDFQRTVWGEDDPADNSDIMLAIQHEGGLVAGAFVEGRMLGFLFGFPTSQPHIQHSHRLAVHPDARGLGLGVKLKWYQRDWCLARDITSVRWTYDPVRRINASLNINRLGATSGTYHCDYYGKMEGINAGVASDRLLAEWDLNSDAVANRAKNLPLSPPDDLDNFTLEIPSDFGALLASDLDAAIAERMRVRDALMTAFAEGFRITGFSNASCRYLLSKS